MPATPAAPAAMQAEADSSVTPPKASTGMNESRQTLANDSNLRCSGRKFAIPFSSFFPKTGLDAYQPLATTVLGGLTAGTILSLIDIPIMHTYTDDLIIWLNRTFLRREWHWPVETEVEVQP